MWNIDYVKNKVTRLCKNVKICPFLLLVGFIPVYVQAVKVKRRAHERAARWLRILDQNWLADSAFMCGAEVTIADYMGASYVTLADWVDFDFSPYPNVTRWLAAMRARPSWDATHGPWNELVAMIRDQRKQSA